MELVPAMSSQPPWWAVPVVAGIFAVGGVTVSQLVTMFLDARRARREDSVRWHAERRRIYALFAAKIGRHIVHFSLKWDDHQTTWTDLADAIEEIDAVRVEVDLIGSKPVRDAADMLWEGLAKGGDYLLSEDDASELTVDEFLRDTRALLKDFVEAARAELGVH
ncbi:hypothetical protein O7598_20645 [Micromonospora sp. WMMC241]|uniref:hypothetical protein n=1 Tax=Micromonospora sp. WMMC241 TaxID=3015159 RepID=UPI0022B6D184|nr:hypothetical protein [Micromonospora sp. WMMC241]MCZ7438834.1 hypothetical protein [Micromonospora sp. WMMC241]